ASYPSGLVYFLNATRIAPLSCADSVQAFFTTNKEEIVSFQELLRFVIARPRYPLGRAGVRHASRKSFPRPAIGMEAIVSWLLIVFIAGSTTAGSQQPSASPPPTIVQQTNTAQQTTGQPTTASLPNPLTLSHAVAIALANNSIVRQAQARLARA